MHRVHGCVKRCVFDIQLSRFSLASGLTEVIQEVTMWLYAACPHFEKFEAPDAWAPFSPTAAPELCPHFTQNEGYVSQTGSNWPLPWFPHWKEQLQKGGARRIGRCVT